MLSSFAVAVRSPLLQATIPRDAVSQEQQALTRLVSRGLAVYCAGGNRREVALSFDDGPGPYTSRLLSELQRPSRPGSGPTPATFFLIGRNASQYPQLVRAEAKLGAVGEHTQTHLVLTSIPPRAAWAQITQGKASVETAAGERVQLFRPPGGHRSSAIDAMVRRDGMISVLYAVDPRDWARRSSRQIVKAVLSDPRLVPGAIVLLHDTHLATVEALPSIIAGLQQRDLQPVTVPALLSDDPPTVAEQKTDARAGGCVHLFERPRPPNRH